MANTKNVSVELLGYYDEKLKVWVKAEDSTNLNAAKKYTDDEIAKIPTAAEYNIVKAEAAEEGFTASYNLTKDGANIGATINIPKDYLVKSATVKTVDTVDTPVAGYVVGDKYIDFVVNTTDGTGNESHIYLLVSELVDVYTAGDGVDVSVDNKISVIAQDGTKTVGGITSADYTEFKGAVTKSNANEEAIEAINNVDTGILAQAKAYTNTETKKVDDKAEANTSAIEAINDPSTGAVATSKAYTDELANGAVKTNTDAIAALNDPDTGVVATSKSYADELNTAMSSRVKALEDIPYATESDIDSLFA